MNLRSRYVWIWIFGICLGWFEAAVVVDLRALAYPDGFRFPLAPLEAKLLLVEVVREAASLLLIAAAARLAAETFLRQFGAFMLIFGIWDLVYYAALRLVLEWPATLADWDILFLLPVPWVGPVWAPMAVAVVLVGAGSWLFLAPEPARPPSAADWMMESACGAAIVAAFMWEWRAVAESRVPQDFPVVLFTVPLIVGAAWFAYSEHRRRRRVG